MSTSKLSTLAGIAEDRAQRSALELDERRADLGRTRAKYERLVAYARDYRRSASSEGLPGELQARHRFQMRIDQHVSDLAAELRSKRETVERMTEGVRDDRASASALQALHARGQDQQRRRDERSASTAFDAAVAARHAARLRSGAGR